ncbi:MAG: penicillin-binding protein 1A [Bacillota bacterium]
MRAVVRVGVALFILVLALTLGVGVGFLAAGIYRVRPVLAAMEPDPALSSLIYDASGNLVTAIPGREKRIYVDLKDIPQHVQEAFLAAEDARFRYHAGVDFRAIARALWEDIASGRIAQGGSTITQQLARNAFLTQERTLSRKVQEAILAVMLEREYTKDQILEMYLNQIFLGHGVYGVQAAAQLYFGKDARDLTVAEGAMLAGITRAPSVYSPYVNFSLAKQMQSVVLDQMVKYGFLDRALADKAAAQPIKLVGLANAQAYPAPWFVDYVLEYLLARYPADLVFHGGLKVYTTLDTRIQKAAEQAVKLLDRPFPLKEDQPSVQAAVVVMDTETGYLRAIVGGRDHRKLRAFNRILAKRQPGSAFKPIIDYAAAFEAGWGTGMLVDDAPAAWPDPYSPDGFFRPNNYDSKFEGLMTVRRALEESRNVPAVKVLDAIGVRAGVEMAQRLGITTLVTSGKHNDMGLATALGGVTEGVRPLDMAVAFAAFANGGVRVQPLAVLKVVDRDGNVLEQSQPQRQVVISRETAYMMTDCLKGVMTKPWGTGRAAAIGRPAAGKTGTTSDWRDAWFVGYTPQLVTAVWMGYDEDKTMPPGTTGGGYPARIWKEVMTEATRNLPPLDWEKPAGLVSLPVCNKSGKLPSPLCPDDQVTQELFHRGTEPTGICDVHVLVTICPESGLLATPFCPNPQEKVMIRRPQVYPADPKGRVPLDAAEEAPREYCGVHASGGPVLPGSRPSVLPPPASPP